MVDGRVIAIRRSGEFVFPGPLIMCVTEISGFGFKTAETMLVCIAWFGKASHDLGDLFGGIRRRLFPNTPITGMLSFHMGRMQTVQFEIFDSIVSSNSVFVVDSFILGEFSVEVLFHYIAVLKHALAVYENSVIAQWRKAWLSLFEMRPIRRNLIGSVPCKATAVLSTIAAIGFGTDVFASVYIAFLAFSHFGLLVESVL